MSFEVGHFWGVALMLMGGDEVRMKLYKRYQVRTGGIQPAIPHLISHSLPLRMHHHGLVVVDTRGYHRYAERSRLMNVVLWARIHESWDGYSIWICRKVPSLSSIQSSLPVSRPSSMVSIAERRSMGGKQVLTQDLMKWLA